MAAGLGFKTFTTGDVLTAGDTNGYLMQGVLVFASAAARDSAITSPQEGQFAYLKDTNVTTYYTGSAWANLDTTGMTNPMTTTGDTIYSSSGSTPARLGIGTTGQVLTVASGVPSWATPAGGSGLTLISTTTVSSGTSVNINNVFSATYDNYLIVAYLSATQDLANFQLRAGGTTTTSGYYYAGNQTNSNASGPTGFWGQNLSDIDLREIGTDVGIITIQVNNPYNSVTTTMSATHIMTNLTRIHTSILGGGVNNSTSYDGFTISLDAGGFSSAGKIRVYGYANS
jgi:hypothetical protein